jgi:hypothetical protein
MSTNDDYVYRSYRYYQGRPHVVADQLPAGVIASNIVVLDAVDGVKVRPIYAEKLANDKENILLLWADFDGDGNYSRDEFVVLKSRSGNSYNNSEPFDRIVSDAGHRHSVRFSTAHSWVRLGKGEWGGDLWIANNLAFTGMLENAGIEINVALQDSDADGLVADFHGGRRAADFDSKLVFTVQAETNRSLWCPVARTMAFGDNYYNVGISMEGGVSNPVAVLSLTLTNPPLTKVRIKGKNVTGVLLTGAQAALRLTPKDGNLLVPCGSWRVEELAMLDGRTEFLFSTEESGTRGLRLVVGRDQDNVLNAGGPLKHGVKIDGTIFGGQITLNLNPSIGVGGENYTVARIPGSPSPQWSIVTSTGHVIASGAFEFG